MNILAIGAHPDDVEFMCAGTLGRLKEKGHRIFMATVANGSCGTMEYSRKEIIKIRRSEAQNSAKLLAAPYLCAGIDDLMVDNVSSIRIKVVEILRQANPDIVFTHALEDYMIDHVSTSILVKDACFCASIPNFPAKGSLIAHVPHLYYALPIEGKDMYGRKIKPDILIDITKQISLKAKMLSCHKSQRDWLKKQHGMDQYIETMKSWAKELGKLAGCTYAEGFRQHLGHGFPQDNILIQLV